MMARDFHNVVSELLPLCGSLSVNFMFAGLFVTRLSTYDRSCRVRRQSSRSPVKY